VETEINALLSLTAFLCNKKSTARKMTLILPSSRRLFIIILSFFHLKDENWDI